MHMQRAIVRRFDPSTWQADLELTGAPTALLPGVPVAAHLGPALLAPGCQVWVCLSGEGNPADGAVLAPFGAPPAPWVSSRLWRPTIATAERTSLAACNSTSFVAVPGLSVTVALEVTGTVLLLLAATGYISNNGITYTLAFYHDDAHETTQLTPVEDLGSAVADVNEPWNLTWLALQSGVAAGNHTYLVKHRVSAGQANLQRGRIVALVAAI